VSDPSNGALASIIQEYVAGVGSAFPAGSIDITENWCVPSARFA
jgi:hypothetical protein